MPAVDGVATFSGLTLNKADTGYTIKATSGTLTAATTTAIAVTPAAATQLVVTTQPPASVAAGATFTVKITAEDQFDNVATSFTGSSVTIALDSNPGGSTLGGTLTVDAVKGVASFSTLTLNKVGTGYTLKATSSGLPTVVTGSINVMPGAASKLVITSEPPTSVVAGSGFGLVATIEDKDGNVVSSSASVTIALSSNPGKSTLGGTLTVPAVNGVATFSGLTLNKADTGYTLKVSSGTLTAATTTAIAVTPAAASQLVVTTQPPASVTAGAAFGLKVSAEDQFGNVVPSFTGSADSVTIALDNNPGGSTLGGTLTVTPVSGVATFSGLTLDLVGTGYTLQATTSGLTLIAAVSGPFNVVPAAAAKLVVTTQPPGSVVAGADFGFAVSVEDMYGNLVTSYSGSVTVALGTNPGGSTLGGTLTVTAVDGVATFDDLTLNNPGTGYTLKVSATRLTGATTDLFDVTSA